MKRIAVILFLTILIGVTGCTTSGLIDNVFSQNVYPVTDSTYDVGSPTLTYDNGYFDNLFIGGVPLVSSYWVADVNGINYSAGSIGVNTPSVANSLVNIYSNNGTESKPVLTVSDNTATNGSTVIYVSTIGAKTNDTYGMRIENGATSGTNGIDKYGLRISSSSVWNGVGSVNYGLYLDNPAGGTTNVAAYIDGTLDMSDSLVDNVGTLNLSDPTELTISGGEITVTQSYHTVDTEADDPIDDLDTINGGSIGDTLTLAGANDAREVRITRNGNVRFQPDHLVEGFSFSSPTGTSGTFYAAGFYASPATDANLTQASTTVTYGTANTPHGSHSFLVAGGAGSTDAGTVSIVVSGTSIDSDGNRTPADSEVLVADITTMALNKYYQTSKRWLGTVTYTLTPAGGATTYSADFNYGKAVYDSFDERLFRIKKLEVMGRAGANDTGFDIQLLHHKSTGWSYSAAAFVPGTAPVCSLATDYGADNDLVINERFSYDRELNENVLGTSGEGLIVKFVTTANKAVEFSDISFYVEAIPNDEHLQKTHQAITLIYNGTYWMEQ
jgi:hypothetical protein